MAELAEEIRRHGATPILLGTYQSSSTRSRQIEKAEGNAARAVHLTYAPISERLRKATIAQPGFAWFAADGMHPGRDLTLLYAILVFQTLYSQPPAVMGFSVEAPIYTFGSGLKPELRSAASPAPQTDTPVGAIYESARVGAVLKDL